MADVPEGPRFELIGPPESQLGPQRGRFRVGRIAVSLQ
jgi:hypothetical protein